jgi:hypothetical protein
MKSHTKIKQDVLAGSRATRGVDGEPLAMIEAEVIRRNVERFRCLLQAELDNTTRLSVEKLLAEFEGKLSAAKTPAAQTENATRMKV